MLSVKKILVPIQGTPLSETTLTTAYLLSKNHNTHISILHIQPDKKDLIPLTSEGLSGAMIEEVINVTEYENKKHLKLTREIIDHFIDEHNIELLSEKSPYPANEGITANFTILTGRESEILTYWTRLSDITVISHPDTKSEFSSSEILHTLLFESGRPIIIAPRDKPNSVGKRICIAWNGSAESAAALHTSLRWINKPEAVAVLYSKDYENDLAKITDVIDFLKFHNINAQPLLFNADKDAGNGVLAACNDFNADMLYMGAYSHPRWQQFILGGVTRYMLENSNLTILMNR